VLVCKDILKPSTELGLDTRHLELEKMLGTTLGHSILFWERWVSIRNMNVAPNHLGVQTTTLLMFPVAVNSNKRGIIKVCLTHKALVVSNIISSSTDGRSFSPCNREAVCQNKLLGSYESGDKELQSTSDCSARRQWDPGISTATAWGQAVFRWAGNVTTRLWAERSPITDVKAQARRSPTKTIYRSTHPSESIEQKYSESRSRFVPFL
jgi:hypothetical protein